MIRPTAHLDGEAILDRSISVAERETREVLYGFSGFRRKLLLSILIGAAAGYAGAFFKLSVGWASNIRNEHPWLLLFLPPAGLLIFALYRLCHYRREPGVDTILGSIRSGAKIRFKQAPLVFFSSILTHLVGGSAGREGAVLEIGGAIGAKIGRATNLLPNKRRLPVLCGMCAAFSALFGAPITAVFFILEITGPKIYHYRGFFFCLVSSLTAWCCFLSTGQVAPVQVFNLPPLFSPETILQVALVSILCGAGGLFFCVMIRLIPAGMTYYCPNGYLRGFLGGTALLFLTLWIGSTRWNGLGADAIFAALGGVSRPDDFFFKTILTAVTLGAGFKGGDIIPALFVGATLGAQAGYLVGLDACCAAALGMVALFSVVTRCRIAAIFLGLEIFGGGSLPICIITALVAYLFSGSWSLFRAR